MLHEIPLSLVATNPVDGASRMYYMGSVGSKPCYSTQLDFIETFWDKSNNYWVHTFNNKSWKNPADTLIPPVTGWSPVSHNPDTGGSGTAALTITVPRSCELPAILDAGASHLGEMNFDATVVGWISEADQYSVLLHPTSPFNRSNKWKLQSKDNLLGYTKISAAGSNFSIPPQNIYSTYDQEDIVVSLSFPAVTEQNLTEAVTNPASSLLGYVAAVAVSELDKASSYATYMTGIITGGRTLAPQLGSRPAVYSKDEIYDPAEDYGKTLEEINKLHIPAPDSLVIDSTSVPGQTKMFVVTQIVETPQGPQTILSPLNDASESSDVPALVNTANAVCMAFFTEYDDGPTKVVIDSKLAALAETSSSYRLVKSNGEVISAVLDGDTVDYGNIDMVEESGIYRFASCITNYSLTEGEVVTLQLLDAYESLISEIDLYAKSASIISDLQLPSSVIVALEVEGSQEYNGGFYLIQNQAVGDIVLTPKLVYSDSSVETLGLSGSSGTTYAIDGGVLAYGLEVIDSTSDVGTTYQIGFKYYIPRNSFLDESVATGTDVNGPYISKEYTLTILSENIFSDISKLSIIPTLVADNQEGDTGMGFTTSGILAYLKDYSDPVVMRGSATDANLTVTITTVGDADTYEMVYDGPLGSFSQTTVLDRNTGEITTLETVPVFNLQDEGSSLVYGGQESVSDIPAMVVTNVEPGLYEIQINPAGAFLSSEEFVTACYGQNNPPTVDGNPPVSPTHFRIRLPNIDGGVNTYAVATAIQSIGNYNSTIESLTLPVLPEDVRVAIIEFLSYNGETYDVLFGSPVSMVVPAAV